MTPSVIERRARCCSTSCRVTHGACKSAWSPQEPHPVWLLRSHRQSADHWLYIKDVSAGLLPEWHRCHESVARETGHNGSDYYEMLQFAACVRGEAKPRVGVDVALDMILPDLISEQLTCADSFWLPVPDSRNW